MNDDREQSRVLIPVGDKQVGEIGKPTLILAFVVIVAQMWFQWVAITHLALSANAVKPWMLFALISFIDVFGCAIVLRGAWLFASTHLVNIYEEGVMRPRFLKKDHWVYWADIEKATYSVAMGHSITLHSRGSKLGIFLGTYEDIPRVVQAVREHLPPGVTLEATVEAENILKRIEQRRK